MKIPIGDSIHNLNIEVDMSNPEHVKLVNQIKQAQKKLWNMHNQSPSSLAQLKKHE